MISRDWIGQPIWTPLSSFTVEPEMIVSNLLRVAPRMYAVESGPNEDAPIVAAQFRLRRPHPAAEGSAVGLP